MEEPDPELPPDPTECPKAPPPDPLREVYARLRDWYQANARDLLDRAPPGSKRAEAIRKSLPAINGLPPADELTDLEVRVVLFQVTSGVLNWSYWDTIDDRAIYELVASTLQKAGLPKDLGEANRKAFRESDSKLRRLFPNQ